MSAFKYGSSLGMTIYACALSAAIASADDFKLEPGFVSMFNGKDFSGWQFGQDYGLPKKLPANWKVEDGVIKLSGGGSPHLGSQWDYEDFDMRFQWRAVRERYNSGFYIRSRRKVGNNQINLAKGGEGNFFRGKMKGGKPVPELQKPPKQWNEWRVLVVDDKVTFWCNGKLAWEGTEFESKRGHIGLQAEGAPLEFRHFRIKEIGYDYLGNARQWPDAAKAASVKFKNYVLRLEWKAAKGAEASIKLRGSGSNKAAVRIGDLAKGSGAIPGFDAAPSKKVDNPLGQWNYMEIQLDGGKCTVWLNGSNVIENLNLKSDGGIGFQFKPKSLQFQNVRIKEIKS